MKYSLKTILILSTAILFSACGGGSSSPETIENKLLGTWDYIENSNGTEQDCEVFNNTSSRYILKISNETIQEIYKSYSNKNCSDSGLKTYIIDIWDYTFVNTKKDKNGANIDLYKIINRETIIKKGTTNKIRTGEERGLAIKFLDSNKMTIEDGPANEIDTVDVNKIKFSTTSYLKRR